MLADFSKVFVSIHRGKTEQILQAYGISKETIPTIMMLYKYIKAMVHSPNGDTNFFVCTAGFLQRDTLAPFPFIICLYP